MTPAEQEALSRVYKTCAIVVPISDGSFGVFGNDRSSESLVIVSEDGLAIAIQNRANRPGRQPKLTQPKPQPEIDPNTTFEDLGL